MSTLPPLYKFLTTDMQSPTGTGTWRKNRWRSVRGDLVPCENGLHATTADNLLPFLNTQLWRVEIDGEHAWHTDADLGRKLVARRMRIVERIDAWNDQSAWLFAADCAERVLPLYEQAAPGDDRPRRAIETARQFALGAATREELDAAGDAAGDAAWAAAGAARAAGAAAAAAWDAARAAARTARAAGAAAGAAWAAARAARAAAGAAAGDAGDAGDAAWDAAWAAARDATRAAERAWQAQHLSDILGLTPERTT